MKQEMLINVAQAEECRIAIVEDGVLEELYIERTGSTNYVGNIYKGVVVNLEPSIQAAFVDFGVGRNGFLHISDVEPQYFRQGGYDPERIGGNRAASRRCDDAGELDFDEEPERPSRRTYRSSGRPRFRPPIQEIFRRGDEVLVQVIKEGIGSKGPTLSTYISIPGRYLVLMPALGRIGVSRKIEDEAQRRRLREIMHELNPPKGLGFLQRRSSPPPPGSSGCPFPWRRWSLACPRSPSPPSPRPSPRPSSPRTRRSRWPRGRWRGRGSWAWPRGAA